MAAPAPRADRDRHRDPDGPAACDQVSHRGNRQAVERRGSRLALACGVRARLRPVLPGQRAGPTRGQRAAAAAAYGDRGAARGRGCEPVTTGGPWSDRGERALPGTPTAHPVSRAGCRRRGEGCRSACACGRNRACHRAGERSRRRKRDERAR